MPRKYRYNRKKYNAFLFDSELFEAVTTYAFVQEPLARALLAVLIKQGLVNYADVTDEFKKIMRATISSNSSGLLPCTEPEHFSGSILKRFLDDITAESPAPLQFPRDPNRSEEE